MGSALLGLALLGVGPAAADRADASGLAATSGLAAGVPCRAGSHVMGRVDLFFGGRPGDARAWRRFVARHVTPRFPDGLTLLEGLGQWRDRGALLREHAHILVIYHALGASSDAKIEAIRAAYKSAFRQTSVLRADSAACVAF